jgi:hypothetical protein
MKRDAKPAMVTLKGSAVANPEQPLVKMPDELDDTSLDDVSGGVIVSKPPDKSTTTLVQIVDLPQGVGSFHPGAWAT